jgi:hypothetical protein
MTQPILSPRLEEIRLAQQAKYAEQRQAFANRELLNTLNRANQTLNNLFLLEKEENK